MVTLRPAMDPQAIEAQSRLERSLRVSEAAEILAVDETTVRDLLRAGLLRGHRVGVSGRGIRIYASSIDEYRQAQDLRPVTARGAPRPAAPKRRKPNAAHAEAMAFLASLGI